MDPGLIHNDTLSALPGYFSPYPGVSQNINAYSYDEGFSQYIIDPHVPVNNFSAEASASGSPKPVSSITPTEYELQSHSPEGQFRDVPFLGIPSSSRNNGYAHTILPPVIQPNPDNPSVLFESETRTFNQRIRPNHSPSATASDPHAANFLRQQLGPDKWNTFSARLFERRLGTNKHKHRSKIKCDEPEYKSCASTIDFLVKVEVVKEILRTYVPHPYNPLKALSHPFLDSPNGQVTLTRSSVLALSGWSNTQFSYWARRVEGISVLSEYDERLKSVVTALEQRLRGGPKEEPDNAIITTTGKGLDSIIDEVKKRTGKSQFLRGKHSSLDPFGSVNQFGLNLTVVPESELEKERGKGDSWRTAAPVYSTSFQALAYLHEVPQGVAGRMDGQAWQGERKQRKRKQRGNGSPGDVDERAELSRRMKGEDNTTTESSPSGSAGSASITESRRSSAISTNTDSDSLSPVSFTTSDSRNAQETTSTHSPIMSASRRRRSTIDLASLPPDIPNRSSARRRIK